jgi:hypothetical protein
MTLRRERNCIPNDMKVDIENRFERGERGGR